MLTSDENLYKWLVEQKEVIEQLSKINIRAIAGPSSITFFNSQNKSIELTYSEASEAQLEEQAATNR